MHKAERAMGQCSVIADEKASLPTTKRECEKSVDEVRKQWEGTSNAAVSGKSEAAETADNRHNYGTFWGVGQEGGRRRAAVAIALPLCVPSKTEGATYTGQAS